MTVEKTIRTAVGIIGNVIALGLFLSPAPTFYGIVKKRATEDFSPFPYVATLANCMLWVLYGLPFVTSDSLLVITINGIGCVIENIYLVIFVWCAPNDKLRARVLRMISSVLFLFLAIMLAVVKTTSDHETRRLVVGTCCGIAAGMMYVAPLCIMYKVVTTKSVKYMPFLPLLAAFLNGATWTAFGFLGKTDWFIVGPNLFGTCLAVIQLILYGAYSRMEKQNNFVSQLV